MHHIPLLTLISRAFFTTVALQSTPAGGADSPQGASQTQDAPAQASKAQGSKARDKARAEIEQGSIKNGDAAPDFTLADCEGKNPITLSKLSGKPTVLVFGSCSCPPFVSSAKATEALYEKYKDRVNFVMVYIREAHPTDGWKLDKNQFQVTTPTSTVERCALAKDFDDRIKVSMPLVVDTIDDPTAKAYSPWPNRMYIIDAQGIVVDAGEAGPRGTAKSAKKAPAILDGLLAKEKSAEN